ncbi:MAG: chitobiase/beta-hexosaminidase C-terminal domain-containing protein [Lachnospiraceae bacterium]|nr:chitobiase/beta-hexosaminidase C-terminal domain-containing protein [Lachnospiraceae bacterium]
MNCTKCNAEIKPGSVFCEKCGEPVQMVPDYNLLDDDFLHSIVEEKDLVTDDSVDSNSSIGDKNNSTEDVDDINKTSKSGDKLKKLDRIINWMRDEKNKKYIIIFLIAFILVVCLSVILFINSYSHCYKMGQNYDEQQDYQIASQYYLRAINRDDSHYEAYLALGIDYYYLEKYEDSITNLIYAISLNDASEDAYRYLIKAYVAIDDYDSIAALKANVTDENILKIFDETMISCPVFSSQSGEYEDDLELTLSSNSDSVIYYTCDNSDPIKSSSRMKYESPILLTEGVTTIKAICEDSNGDYSQVVENVYTIVYGQPDKPIVSTESGTFNTETFITVTVPEGSEVYYTWDGSIPNASSSCYREPIRVIEGNNILSLITIDKHGNSSDVLECNYKYLP